MNKKVKKLIAIATIAGAAMYAFNKFIEYTSSYRGLTLEDDENYYNWRNGTIYYKKKGTGQPILLLHDLNPISSTYEWGQIIESLSKTNTVYAIDLLGCGKSDKPASSYGNYLYVQLVNDFIQDVIKEKTDLIVTGESFSFAVMAARMDQNMIGKITAINPSDITCNVQSPTVLSEILKHMIELPIIGTFIYNTITNTKAITKLFTEKYYKDTAKIPVNLTDTYYESAHLQGSNGKYLYASMIGKYTNINIIHALKMINNPVHFILTDAASDEITEYQTYNHNITIDHISEAGYLPQLEKPDEVISLLYI